MATRIAILLILSILAACNTEKRAIKQIAYIGQTRPNVAANYCASVYPARVETKSTIEYRKGNTDTLWQSLYVDCDTVIGETRIVKIPYPVNISTKDTLIYRDSVFTENTAKIEALKHEADKLQTKLIEAKKKAKNSLYGGLILGAMIVLAIFVIAKRL